MTEGDRGWRPSRINKNPDGTVTTTTRIPDEGNENRTHTYKDRIEVKGSTIQEPEQARRERADRAAKTAAEKGIPQPTHAARTAEEMGLND